MYVLIDKNNKVIDIRNTIPSYYSDNLTLAEVEVLPETYDYLTVENIRGGEVVDGVKTPITCDLIPQFRVRREPTTEQLEAIKHKKYEARTEELIAKKYSIKQEIAIARQKEIKPEEYQAYYNYCEECKTKAHIEIYGE